MNIDWQTSVKFIIFIVTFIAICPTVSSDKWLRINQLICYLLLIACILATNYLFFS